MVDEIKTSGKDGFPLWEFLDERGRLGRGVQREKPRRGRCWHYSFPVRRLLLHPTKLIRQF